MKHTILILTGTLGLGGLERAAQTFALALHAREDFIVLYGANDTTGPRKEILQKAGIPVFAMRENDINHVIQNNNVTIVFGHCFSLRSITVPNILKIQENVFAGCYDETAEINLPISNMLALKMLMQNPHHTLHVLHYPVDTTQRATITPNKKLFLEKNKISSDAHLFGRIARAEPSKWDFAFLEIAKGVFKRDPQAHMLTVGLPLLYRLRLRRYRKRITNFHTTSDDHHLGEVYNALDVFVHTAQRGETFGYVLAEAMLFKKPVVALSTPFIKKNGTILPHVDNSQAELVEDGVTGYVAEDTGYLITKTLQLLNDVSQKIMLGEAGYQKVLRDYACDSVIQKFIDIVQSPANHHTAKGTLTQYDLYTQQRYNPPIGLIIRKRIYLSCERVYLVIRKVLKYVCYDIERL